MNKIKKLSFIFIIMIVSIVAVSASGFSFNLQKTETLNQDISTLQNQLNDLSSQLQTAQNELQSSENEFGTINQEVQSLRTGNENELHDPTYREIVEFITEELMDDDSSLSEIYYDSLSYENFENTIEIQQKAISQGIRCCIATLDLVEDYCYIIGFDTIDQGMIYYDTYGMYFAENLETGNEYYSDCVNFESFYEICPDLDDSYGEEYDLNYWMSLLDESYFEPEWDDTIEEVLLLW